jgi:predicted RecA/RadA family phage recombinase
MKNFKFNGQTMTMIAAAAVVSGQIVVKGDIVGVAVVDAAAGESFEVQLTGVIELAKDETVAIDQGDKVYTDGSVVNKTDTDSEIGVCFRDETAASDVVLVRLKGGAASFNTL